MKILSAEEIRLWDQYTIENEPILSIELMERAALSCVEWITAHYPSADSFSVFCGKGNNGGDGLAVARLLLQKKFAVSVFILEFGHLGTNDFQANLARLHAIPGNDIHFIQTEENFHPLTNGEIIIDALYGSGLNRKLEGVTAALVEHINESGCPIISVDIPSGMFVDHSSKGNLVVKATHTLSFQCFKPAFLFAENAGALSALHILDIGLNKFYYERLENKYELTDQRLARSLYKKRNQFAHKGNYGHALIIAGSLGKMGAALLAGKSCLRTGAGLLTMHVPAEGLNIVQTAFPEAMAEADLHSTINTKIENELVSYDAIGIGPGLGTNPETILLLENILETSTAPLVIDADGLNCLSLNKDLLKKLPAGTLLTPHPKEFDRLFGESANDFERMMLAEKKANELNAVIVLKGHHTCIASAHGKTYFNSTGNPGMATAGSGDVLTGMLTSLLAQGYSSVEAAIFGVYLHGLAGDIAASQHSMESMIASDITGNIGKAFLSFQTIS